MTKNFIKNTILLLLTLSIFSALHISFHSDFIHIKSTLSDLSSDVESQENQEAKSFELFNQNHSELKILKIAIQTESTSNILQDQFHFLPLTSPPNA